MTRYAQAAASPDAVAPYLPANYSATPVPGGSGTLIVGEDNAGWTLDGYVIPRLASGLIFAREIQDCHTGACARCSYCREDADD